MYWFYTLLTNETESIIIIVCVCVWFLWLTQTRIHEYLKDLWGVFSTKYYLKYIPQSL